MRAITALSIGNDAIRAAVIDDPYTDSPTIKHFQAIPLPTGAVVDGEVVDVDVVTGILKTLVERFKFPRENTALVYSSRRMVFREADFPFMPLADLRSTLPFQAKGMIPLPIDESELDFVPMSIVNNEQEGKQLHGILVATLRRGLKRPRAPPRKLVSSSPPSTQARSRWLDCSVTPTRRRPKPWSMSAATAPMSSCSRTASLPTCVSCRPAPMT